MVDVGDDGDIANLFNHDEGYSLIAARTAAPLARPAPGGRMESEPR